MFSVYLDKRVKELTNVIKVLKESDEEKVKLDELHKRIEEKDKIIAKLMKKCDDSERKKCRFAHFEHVNLPKKRKAEEIDTEKNEEDKVPEVAAARPSEEGANGNVEAVEQDQEVLYPPVTIERDVSVGSGTGVSPAVPAVVRQDASDDSETDVPPPAVPAVVRSADEGKADAKIAEKVERDATEGPVEQSTPSTSRKGRRQQISPSFVKRLDRVMRFSGQVQKTEPPVDVITLEDSDDEYAPPPTKSVKKRRFEFVAPNWFTMRERESFPLSASKWFAPRESDRPVPAQQYGSPRDSKTRRVD
jgi:hypothetical protein